MNKELVFYVLLFCLGIALAYAAVQYAEAYLPWGNDKPLKFDYKLEICSLTETKPGYDCSETWLVVSINADYFLIPYTNETVKAIGYYGSKPSRWVDIDPADDYKYAGLIVIGKQITDSCYNYICYPLILHEAKHIWCECVWHEDMKSARELDQEKDQLGFL